MSKIKVKKTKHNKKVEFGSSISTQFIYPTT